MDTNVIDQIDQAVEVTRAVVHRSALRGFVSQQVVGRFGMTECIDESLPITIEVFDGPFTSGTHS